MRRVNVSAEAMDGGSGGGRRQRTGSGVSYVLSTLFCLYLSTYFIPISHQIRQEMDEEDKHVTVEQSR